jgi:hypothetical protein
MSFRRRGLYWQVVCILAAVSCSSPEDEDLQRSSAGTAGRSANAGRGGAQSASGSAGQATSGGRSGSSGRGNAPAGQGGSSGTGVDGEAGDGGLPDGQGGTSAGSGSGASAGAAAGAQGGSNSGGSGGDGASGGSGNSSGSANGGRAGSNTVTDGPIRISENGRYLTDADGDPILVFGDAAWNLGTQLSVSEQNHSMDTRASQGLNAFTLMLISVYADNSPNDADDVPPFTTPGDFGTFNPPYFEKVVDLVGRAAQRGLLVFLAPTWAGYDSSQGFYDAMVQSGEAKMRDYGSAVANLFKDFDNVVWIIGGDMRPPIPTPLFDAMTEGIRAVDDRHLLTSHWNFAPGDNPSGDWEDIVSCYEWNNGVQYPQIRGEYNENEGPVVLLESLYELNTDFGATTKILRFQTIQALLFGARGTFFGHEGVWHLGSTNNAALGDQSEGKPYDLDSIGIRQQQHVNTFFRSRAWHELEPDSASEFVTSGRGNDGDNGYVGASKTPDGRLGVAYLPNGGTIGVDLAKLVLPVQARWFDPTNGEYQEAGRFGDAEVESFTSPTTNSSGDGDFILVLESD